MSTRYPVLHCDRIGTKYGEAVCLTLREEAEDNVIRVFLPRHYGMTFTEEDVAAINSRDSVLPYVQREQCSLRPPYVTDGCIICGARNLMSAVEGFNLASGHGGHVKHCYYFF